LMRIIGSFCEAGPFYYCQLFSGSTKQSFFQACRSTLFHLLAEGQPDLRPDLAIQQGTARAPERLGVKVIKLFVGTDAATHTRVFILASF